MIYAFDMTDRHLLLSSSKFSSPNLRYLLSEKQLYFLCNLRWMTYLYTVALGLVRIGLVTAFM